MGGDVFIIQYYCVVSDARVIVQHSVSATPEPWQTDFFNLESPVGFQTGVFNRESLLVETFHGFE